MISAVGKGADCVILVPVAVVPMNQVPGYSPGAVSRATDAALLLTPEGSDLKGVVPTSPFAQSATAHSERLPRAYASDLGSPSGSVPPDRGVACSSSECAGGNGAPYHHGRKEGACASISSQGKRSSATAEWQPSSLQPRRARVRAAACTYHAPHGSHGGPPPASGPAREAATGAGGRQSASGCQRSQTVSVSAAATADVADSAYR